MELMAERDLLKDDYGNFYMISNASGDSLTVVNAALYYAFNETLDDALVAKVRNQYPNEIACGKYFADLVEVHIEKLEKGEVPGGIYSIDEAKQHYNLHIKPIYGDSFNA
ncbi:hypothetical protein QWY15_03125 [Planococcus sp. N064]|uniref:Uncharacterized protein n=1 Tax=Planococcus liqunii TaxID=3058394 RepID=A0ABT8MN18_9BACL|nr:hypothetical protein [Planococcus sp. N064]MDN7226277.1 hypothetical protein [Planococcus sp. N064]